VSPTDSNKIKQIIRKDTEFFYKMGLIDYSLIIMKLDYNAILLDYGNDKLFENIKIYKSSK
jgi:hypothetical protein